jgi:hypothetical protein
MLALALVLPLWVAVTGALPAWLASLGPGLDGLSAGLAALGLFLAGALAIWLVAVVAALTALRLRRARGQA